MTKSLLDSLTHQPEELGFGTSGLRGKVSDMTDLECYINTRGFIEFLLGNKDIEPGSEVVLSGDLRSSTPRILHAVAKGISDSSCKIMYIGQTMLPAAAYFGLLQDCPVAMVTGSHIPDDRNGIKFYKREGEVLKTDEAVIKAAVAKVRNQLYSQPSDQSIFDKDGGLKYKPDLPEPSSQATEAYIERYLSLFPGKPLAGKQIVVYQHSSLAAEPLVTLLKRFGATVEPVDKSEKFIPIDTENVTPANQAYFKSLAKKYPQNFAIVSADGDADRPFVVDETGVFHRGDILGALTATFLKARSAVVPVSANDAVDKYLAGAGIELIHTKIGSPYVIAGMLKSQPPVVGWEVNGGFLTGSDIEVGAGTLKALATRDAFLPIVCSLISAAQQNIKLSKLFAGLPKRYTQAGLLDEFPVETSQAILRKYADDTPQNHQGLERIFSPERGFDKVTRINSMDGIRITFDNGDIAHVRPSGNAPQLRIYSVADSQKRADKIVELALANDGLLRQLASSL